MACDLPGVYVEDVDQGLEGLPIARDSGCHNDGPVSLTAILTVHSDYLGGSTFNVELHGGTNQETDISLFRLSMCWESFHKDFYFQVRKDRGAGSFAPPGSFSSISPGKN